MKGSNTQKENPGHEPGFLILVGTHLWARMTASIIAHERAAVRIVCSVALHAVRNAVITAIT
jgi:hypothetical protein